MPSDRRSQVPFQLTLRWLFRGNYDISFRQIITGCVLGGLWSKTDGTECTSPWTLSSAVSESAAVGEETQIIFAQNKNPFCCQNDDIKVTDRLTPLPSSTGRFLHICIPTSKGLVSSESEISLGVLRWARMDLKTPYSVKNTTTTKLLGGTRSQYYEGVVGIMALGETLCQCRVSRNKISYSISYAFPILCYFILRNHRTIIPFFVTMKVNTWRCSTYVCKVLSNETEHI